MAASKLHIVLQIFLVFRDADEPSANASDIPLCSCLFVSALLDLTPLVYCIHVQDPNRLFLAATVNNLSDNLL